MRTFRSIIARESVETDEGFLTRVFPAGCFRWGDGPWPMTVHHDDAALNGTVLGQCQSIERLGDLIIGRGFLDDEGTGAASDLRRDLIRQIGLGMINAISVEAAGLDVEEECTATDEDGWCTAVRVTFTRYEIGVASVVTIPAIEGTLIELDPDPVDAAQPEPAALVASAVDELVVPAAWLLEPDDLPDLDAPGSRVPRVTDDGRVYGWLCSWSDCHVNFPDYCQTPWRSQSGYAYVMHSGPFLTDEGERVALAPLSAAGGHYTTEGAPARDWRAARRHYDDPDTCAAYVAVGENERGIWFSGIVRPDAPERLTALLARHQLSGDWRRPFGDWELMGVCSINQPGFVRRAAFVASADPAMPLELVAAIVASPGPVHLAESCGCGGTCASCAPEPVAVVAAMTDDEMAAMMQETHDMVADIHDAIVDDDDEDMSGAASLEARLAVAEARLAVVFDYLEPTIREDLRARLSVAG